MSKKEYCCDMSFEVGGECCKDCEHYYDILGDVCFFHGIVKNNDTKEYKKFSGIVFALWWDKICEGFKIIAWHEEYSLHAMNAFFELYKELGMCDTWEEHVEFWKDEDYLAEGFLEIPQELITPLRNDELENYLASPIKVKP